MLDEIDDNHDIKSRIMSRLNNTKKVILLGHKLGHSVQVEDKDY